MNEQPANNLIAAIDTYISTHAPDNKTPDEQQDGLWGKLGRSLGFGESEDNVIINLQTFPPFTEAYLQKIMYDGNPKYQVGGHFEGSEGRQTMINVAADPNEATNQLEVLIDLKPVNEDSPERALYIDWAFRLLQQEPAS